MHFAKKIKPQFVARRQIWLLFSTLHPVFITSIIYINGQIIPRRVCVCVCRKFLMRYSTYATEIDVPQFITFLKTRYLLLSLHFQIGSIIFRVIPKTRGCRHENLEASARRERRNLTWPISGDCRWHKAFTRRDESCFPNSAFVLRDGFDQCRWDAG